MTALYIIATPTLLTIGALGLIHGADQIHQLITNHKDTHK